MKPVTALRWLNGTTLLIAIAAWLVFAILSWIGGFTKAAGQTLWNTGVMFASGFQRTPRSPEPPGVAVSHVLALLTLAALWISVFIPARTWWMHSCAAAAGLLMAWCVWMLRADALGQGSMVVLAIWFGYYWAAVWRG